MNISEFGSNTNQRVILQVLLRSDQTKQEVMEAVGTNRNRIQVAMRELKDRGFLETYHFEGERQVRLRATLPEPLAVPDVWERSVLVQESEGTQNAKVAVGYAAVYEIFPSSSYKGARPTHEDVRRWLKSVGWDVVRFYEVIERGRDNEVKTGPINYIDRMILNAVGTTTDDIQTRQAKKNRIADALEAKVALQTA